MTNGAFIPLAAALKRGKPDAEAHGSDRFAALATASASAPAESAPCGEPKVELERDGTRIKRIRVICRCGEVTELACDY